MGSPDVLFALALALTLIAPLAPAGLIAINVGMGRSRSAAHAAVAGLCCFSAAVLAYLLLGCWFDGLEASTGYSFTSLPQDGYGSPHLERLLLQLSCAGVAAIIPLGAGADRWKLRASCLSAALTAAFIYPLFLNATLYSRFVAKHGDPLYVGSRFTNVGGAATIHLLGGLFALAVAWQLGPRRGKYSSAGAPSAIPAHHIVFVILGSLLALLGFTALHTVAALLCGVAMAALPLVVINTVAAASAGALAALFVTSFRYGKPDASLIANGWVAGIVASSAGCALMTPAAAIFTGLIAGIIVPCAIEFLELRLRIDDPGGVISVHGLAGIWSLLAAGIFSFSSGQMLAQLVGISAVVGIVLPFACLQSWVIGRFVNFRVDPADEALGMDIAELGSGAYPEFVTHADEFVQL